MYTEDNVDDEKKKKTGLKDRKGGKKIYIFWLKKYNITWTERERERFTMPVGGR